jgi:hypothetical protein
VSPEYPLEKLVSDENIQRWTDTYGQEANDWLARLPAVVAEYAEKWELGIEEPLEGGTVSAVIGAVQNAKPVVLKIHPPWLTKADERTSSIKAEASAYRIWDGEGAPRLLADDDHALLLERITPAEHSPDMTAQEVATLIMQIRRPIDLRSDDFVASGLPFLQEELWRRYWRAEARRPKEISEVLLLGSITMAHYIGFHGAIGPSWDLVHGDFKPKNILKKPDGSFVVIDPSPAFGSLLYDVALWAIDDPRTMLQRCDEAAEYLKADSQILGSLALALSIPEICLASPARAEVTLERVKEITGTNDLEQYFREDFMTDAFMNREYVVIKTSEVE